MRAALPLVCLAVTACAGPTWKQVPHDEPFQRVPAPQLHAPPPPRETSDWWGAIRQTTVRPLSESLNPGYWAERALGSPPALDVNRFGQVVDSPWFENRIARDDLSPQRLARGPNRDDGPADGPLVVLGGKLQGATPGLIVEDRRKDRFVIKFDPAAYSELASGAEVIATKILWAAGYHVPENHVLRFDLDRLALSPQAETGGPHGDRVPLTEARLRDLIAHVNPYPDGTIRALFSKLIPGQPLGPFAYEGQRKGDPNDRIPHQRRRSLRGLWLISAWLNNVDTRESNTLDVFVASEAQPDLGHVQHYLLDFGDALGSAGTGPKYIGEGYEGRLDWPLTMQGLLSAGLWYRYWLPVQRSPFRSVGVYESQVFDPERWRPNLPNPAFDVADIHDAYWAASLIARFDVEDLIAIVAEAQYSDKAAEAWILRVLLQRQYQILTWVFDRVLPLDRLRIVDGYRVVLEDLAMRAALVSPDQVGYDWQVRWNRAGEDVLLDSGQDNRPRLDLTGLVERLRDEYPAQIEKDPFLTVTFRRPLPTEGGPRVQVHLRILAEGLLPVGIEREVK